MDVTYILAAMNTLSRKQREMREREALFLDIAERLLHEGGHQALTMDRIAELAEYSKGTVYQHFKCKEEVLINLCWRGLEVLGDLFERAATFDGNGRERMLACLLAHRLYAGLHPLHFDMINTVKAGGVKEKLSADSLQRHAERAQRVHATIAGIVFAARQRGELPDDPRLAPMELVYGLWSLSFGGLTLQTFDIDFAEMGVADPDRALEVLASCALDGVGWRPLSSEHDYATSAARIARELFADEFAALASDDDTAIPPPTGKED